MARVSRELHLPGVDLTCKVLPVEYKGARSRVLELGHFDVHLALGLASDRTRPTLERFAMNRMDASIPDEAGYLAVDEEINPGPLALETTIPVRELAQAAVSAGYPCGVSLSAGLYVCNTVLYTGIETSTHAGFLHVPPADVFSVDDGVGLVSLLLGLICKE